MPTGSAWAAVVLTGGRSRRMGRDKALLQVGGVPMADRVARACVDAGAVAVAFGGDLPGLEALGRAVLADDPPGVGPLGGVAAALAWSPTPWCLIASCDLVTPDPGALRTLAAARRSDVHAVVPVVDGVRQVLHALWSRSALPAVEDAIARGDRAVRDALAALAVLEVHHIPGAAVADADRPEDLPAG